MLVHVVDQRGDVGEAVGLLLGIEGGDKRRQVVRNSAMLKEGIETVTLYHQQVGGFFQHNIADVAGNVHSVEGNLCRGDGVILVVLLDLVDG